MKEHEYKGFKFTTNKGIKCIIVENTFSSEYAIIDINDYKILASDKYENLEKLIQIIKYGF